MALAIFTMSSCDDDDTRLTARVDSVSASQLCVTPEDPKQSDLIGCYSIEAEDAANLSPGTCVDLRIPDQLDPELRDDPVGRVTQLDRNCHVGSRSTDLYLKTFKALAVFAVCIAAVSAAVVFAVKRRRAQTLRNAGPKADT
jgi:hypothetical protein